MISQSPFQLAALSRRQLGAAAKQPYQTLPSSPNGALRRYLAGRRLGQLQTCLGYRQQVATEIAAVYG